jgi:hypothetical protein
MIPMSLRQINTNHYIVQDWMGAITEISDTFDYTYIRSAKDFVTRKWHKFPVETHKDWEEMSYDSSSHERYPDDLAQKERIGRDQASDLFFFKACSTSEPCNLVSCPINSHAKSFDLCQY